MVDVELATGCESVAATAEKALAWIADIRNDPRIGQERAFLERAIRSHAYRARRLRRSLERPMSVGVFGPSQAGKSYLVSVLARKDDTLSAVFDDPERPEIDFIKDINPYGEKEATGLVTRFSIEKPATPPGFPVALRVLTQTDLLKILSNSFFLDGDQQEEEPLSPEAIDAHISGFEPRLGPGPAGALREEDIWDVEEYFQRQLRRGEAKVFNPFWERLARMAPRLSLADRAEFFSILWGRHEQLTQLFRELLDALDKLSFAEEAYCSIAALVPATKSILNVEALAGLGGAGAEPVRLAVAGGRAVDLPRPVVTALAAELRIQLKERPWPFLEHTDLLDFPGYRGRTQHNLGKYLRESKGEALKELFLRGKVDYLFQRYTAEQELTSMLLCLRPSNLDVTTLPAVIEEWIAVTHGRTPEDRRHRPVLLFFLFTMFDQHLAEKAGDEGVDPGLRFQSRIEASLLKPFAKLPESWPVKWTPEQPFKNCYWIRNPNYKAEGVIQYEGRQEIAIVSGKIAERIARLREGYLRVPEVTRHFADPARAFDEVMKLNDGGISFLASNLEAVCKPGMKQAQVKARLDDLKNRLVEMLVPHYVPTDADKRVRERIAVAEAVIADFEECVARQTFGTFLRALCVDRAGLSDALYESRTRGGGAGGTAAPSPGAEKPPRRGGLLSLVKSGANGEAPAAAPSSAAFSGYGASERGLRLARSALEFWASTIFDVIEDDAFADFIGVSRNSLKEVAAEVIASSRRRGIEAAISQRLDSISHIEKIEQSVAKATVVAERQINGFVSTLGTARDERPTAFDVTGIGQTPANFQQDFIVNWLKSFYAETVANAQSGDGLIHDPEQNALLGQIIAEATG
ncbi:MAG: putative virulence factor [Beijerinckiaceae bacterium]|nr:putative virulence factor [Beijerinckiaceae bacterium]MCI0736842.1 putative virulence factor [Beijerinckiaceae bacterium]